MKPPRSGAARGAILCERLHDAATVLMLAGVLFVTATAPAAADDCSGPEDCGNVVQGGGMLAMLLAVLLGAAATKGKIARQPRRGPEWVHEHVLPVAGATTPQMSVEVVSRTDGSPPTRVVRIAPHADSGTQFVEEITQ